MWLCAIVANGALSCQMAPIRWAGDDWMADYDTSEAHMRESSRPLLIVFKNNRRGQTENMEELLRSDSFEGLTDGFVKCVLLRSYEPDRRYVAQFGVQRAPALIIVHTDGTYHARTGTMTAQEMRSFLADARPPGEQPALNPYIPRQPRYTWYDSLDEAEVAARQTGRSMVVLFYRRLSGDWSRFEKLLERREVYTRLADMVHCRIGVVELWDRSYERRFGKMHLPAMVIVAPDGSQQILENPASYEAIARFADAAHDPDGAPGAAARASGRR